MRGTLALKELNKVDCFSYRSSHQRCPVKNVVVLESLFNKVAGLQACSFIKKRLQQRCFPVKLAKFLRTPILKNICERPLLFLFSSKIVREFVVHKEFVVRSCSVKMLLLKISHRKTPPPVPERLFK